MADWGPFLEGLTETWPAKLAKSIYHGAKAPGEVLSGQYNVEPSVPGQWSDVDEARLHANYNTMMNRGQDLAGLAMGGGIPSVASKTPGVTLTSGLPPVLGAYHGTSTPAIYSQFKSSRSGMDLGTHVGIDPGIASQHASRTREMPRDVVRPRIMPVVADVNAAFRFPGDPRNWASPDAVLSILENVAAKGGRIPKSMLSDFVNIEKQAGGWGKNFIPAMQEKGFDAIFYPHFSPRDPSAPMRKYNSLMAFEGKQVTPRYSPEGQELIAQRGIVEPMKTAPWYGHPDPGSYTAAVRANPDIKESWRMPQGILKPYDEMVPARQFGPEFKQRRDAEWAIWNAQQDEILKKQNPAAFERVQEMRSLQVKAAEKGMQVFMRESAGPGMLQVGTGKNMQIMHKDELKKLLE